MPNPPAVIKPLAAVTFPAAVESIERYLAAKGCTLWADWDISSASRRRVAAEWLAGQIAETVDFINAEKASAT